MTADGPVILFAPGAGAASSSAWMQGWRRRLTGVAGAVVTLDYPYRLAGRKAPDKLPVLIAAHTEALTQVRARHPAASGVILAGKSMGGRVGCHVAAASPGDVAGVICFGYPLRGARGTLRDEVLLSMRSPVLFIQGTRDPLCPLDALEGVLLKMTAPHTLFVVEGGNHSLEVPRKRATRAVAAASVTVSGEAGSPAAPSAQHPRPAQHPDGPQESADAAILQAVRTFIEGLSARLGGSPPGK